MDKLKLYAAPIVALILVLLWFLVVQPKISAGTDDQVGPTDKAEAKAPGNAAAQSE